MLTQTQIDQFTSEGYTIAPDFFDREEVALLQAEVARLQAQGLLRNVRTEGDGATTSATQANLQLCPASPHSRPLLALPFAAKVRATVDALIGGPSVRLLDQIFLKPAHHGSGTAWHQDDAYWGVRSRTAGFGMWIAVDDATVANGTMRIIPGSHTSDFAHRRDPNSDHHIRCDPDEALAIPVEVEAGGALLFNFGIAHCTRANTTERDRAGLAYHFTRCDNLPAKQGYDQRRGALPLLTGPGYCGGREELGENLDGAWADLLAARRTLV